MSRHKMFDYSEKLTAAREVFGEKGYHATSMNDLVETIKLSRSSLYDSFGGKHELYMKCLDKYIKDKEIEYFEAAGKGKNPLTTVKEVVYGWLDEVLSSKKTSMVVYATFELGRTDLEVQARLKQYTLWLIKLIAGLLEKAKSSGELKTCREPEAIAHFVVLGFASIWNTHILFSNDQLTREMTSLLMADVTN